VTQQRQMRALVIDFGGGTCDVCIIETTREGEISGGGRNKRPLAGKSLPVGGLMFNRAIAESLIRRIAGAFETAVKTGLREYKDWYAGRRSLDSLDSRYKIFIDNFHNLVHRVERLKLALSRAVTDWSLTANQHFAATITIPQDPFERGGKNIPVTMSIAQLRDIFVETIYTPHLRQFFADRLKVGREMLEGAPLTVLLLSGGSANLKWLQELLRRDFAEYLYDVPVVQIRDYQQVVAHGLAVDCAREFAIGTSDFRGVTYNPLFLLLDADESGCEPRPLIARTPNLPDVRQRPGLLIPTASVMVSFIDQPMRWRVKLNRAPRRKLDYFFLQGSMDPSDTKSLQNVEQTTLFTPAGCSFDNALQVELTIRTDGTAIPKFIYRAEGGGAPEIAKEGRKFVIDITDAAGGGGEAYLGLDFGTSNTTISYIDRAWLEEIDSRSNDPNWKEIGELVDLLPSPLALPLARYIGDFSHLSPVPPGLSFIEAGLCLTAYVSYMELCCIERRATTRIFKGFPHRSASYLWHMLKSVHDQLGTRAVLSQPFQRLCAQSNRELFDRITRRWADVRHEKAHVEERDLLSAVQLLANVSHIVFSNYAFGFFEGVQKERFSSRHAGRFRIAHGKPPYTSFATYVGPHPFSDAEALVVNMERGEGLSLTPLVFWYHCQSHRDHENGHCFLFDKMKDEGREVAISYKAAGFPCHLEITGAQEEMAPLVESLRTFTSQDSQLRPLGGMKFTDREDAASQALS
jgi:hypothetical protein